jgi:phenylalanyl-tRNA synthetase alpha chain
MSVRYCLCCTDPARTLSLPRDYEARVKDVHERGGYGSTGYCTSWSPDEAAKNILRTHTTAVSSRMLYELAKVSSGGLTLC